MMMVLMIKCCFAGNSTVILQSISGINLQVLCQLNQKERVVSIKSNQMSLSFGEKVCSGAGAWVFPVEGQLVVVTDINLPSGQVSKWPSVSFCFQLGPVFSVCASPELLATRAQPQLK